MIDHFWLPSGDAERPWVYLTVPRTPTCALVADSEAPGGISAHTADETVAPDALAVLITRGPDTFVVTRGRLNARPVSGGIGHLRHQDALSVPLDRDSAAQDGNPPTLFACTDGLVEVFEYEPPEEQAVPALCAVCGLPLKAGERVRRACPGPGAACGMLIHEECSGSRCPACQQEIADPTGRSTIWMPGE